MSRRSADRWADEWAIAQGLKKPPKSATTSGQVAKSKPSVDGKVAMSISFIVDEQRQEEFVKDLSDHPKPATDYHPKTGQRK